MKEIILLLVFFIVFLFIVSGMVYFVDREKGNDFNMGECIK